MNGNYCYSIMSLTIDQQKRLFDEFYDYITDLHVSNMQDLKQFTFDYRNKNQKGVVLLEYYSIKEMIQSVKNKDFQYQWVSRDEIGRINHNAIPSALASMSPKKDCIFVCSLLLEKNHQYVNLCKMKDLDR